MKSVEILNLTIILPMHYRHITLDVLLIRTVVYIISMVSSNATP